MELEIKKLHGMVPMMMRNFANCKTIKMRSNYLNSHNKVLHQSNINDEEYVMSVVNVIYGYGPKP